jgi:hypothetical protein
MPGETVCKEWLKEFYRLRGKVYSDYDVMLEQQKSIAPWSADQYQPINIFEEMFGQEKKEMYELDDLDFGAEEEKDVTK